MGLPEKCSLCHADRSKQNVVTTHVFGAQKEKKTAFFHCTSCDVRYQYPGLTPDEEIKFYSAEFEKFMSIRSGESGGWLNSERHVLANETTRLRRMGYLKGFLTERCEILEVGCSSGFMLFPLRENGHTCVGVEPSGVFSEFVREQGMPVYTSIDELAAENDNILFDLILHFFVLEHSSNPIEFLNNQLKLLRPGGKIIFEVPNSADPLYTVYDIPAFERFYWSVAHPWYFSEQSLKYLLNQTGCSHAILRDQRYDLSNHMIWARDGRPGGMGRFSEILGPEIDRQYKDALINSGQCDTLIGIVYKD